MSDKTTICAWVSTETKEELEELLTEGEKLSAAVRKAVETEIKLRKRAIQDFEGRRGRPADVRSRTREEDVSRETS